MRFLLHENRVDDITRARVRRNLRTLASDDEDVAALARAIASLPDFELDKWILKHAKDEKALRY